VYIHGKDVGSKILLHQFSEVFYLFLYLDHSWNMWPVENMIVCVCIYIRVVARTNWWKNVVLRGSYIPRK